MEPANHPPLRYVVLSHEGIEHPHLDLMFETHRDKALSTGRAPRWPVQAGDPVEPLAGHRREYLEYEGPISNNRGNVRRIASGVHHIEQDDSVAFVTRLEDGSIVRLSRSPIP